MDDVDRGPSPAKSAVQQQLTLVYFAASAFIWERAVGRRRNGETMMEFTARLVYGPRIKESGLFELNFNGDFEDDVDTKVRRA
jgi:hypothetical protein